MNRPFALDPMFRALTALPGVGPRNGKLFEKLTGGPKVLDLLFHLPVDFVDRRFSPKVRDIPDGRVVTLSLIVDAHQPAERRGKPYRVLCRDETGFITLVFFNASRDWIARQLPENQPVIVSGRVEFFNGRPQIVHPDAIGAPEDRADIETVEPVYPLTAGLTNKIVRKTMLAALECVRDLPEWLDPAFRERNGWTDWDEAVRAVHMAGLPPSRPPPSAARGELEGDTPRSLDPLSPVRQRLAYDELLSNQLAISLVRHRQRKARGREIKGTGALREAVTSALPFALTGAQERALAEIDADMGSDSRMLRLLQGDVGSGKTVVAALAMMNALENGAQAALMAPTEILARQHAESLRPWLEAAGVRQIVMTGRNKGKEREVLLQQIRNGAAQVIIGTHALFQEGVDFADLGLAVIDEQHRFGVHQRLQLSAKGKGTDVLVMTATPIPRTLTLTAYGDMDVSRLDEKPPGRKPVDTRLLPKDRIAELVEGLKRRIATGARVYWVCPLVEESELSDMAAAEERYDVLTSVFGERVGLVHGRMKPLEKDAVMDAFARGDLDILVATTVIEVGVNVPEATVMVVEHAERFGLAQLHQLRGRVGRGADKSFCFLLYAYPLSETAKERLSIMRDTEDGFLIAEKDLELRGGGDVLGVRQSGLPAFRLADLAAHADLLKTAYDDARLIIDRDPDLQSERGEALRTLLYLFERDQAIRLLRSG
ncbi:MAG: ATP-dependent DNA helicase RecG [Alphaproteobacteria bacterium]|nr:ATP-dependent DNA helicase RecG [Alphaproteobacteria bacterium]